MCTVSWIHEGGGYQLFCNRDEKLTRRPASDPQVLYRNGVRFLAPIDADAGGTWLATNEFGLTLCLLNGSGTGILACAPFSKSKTHRQECRCHQSRGVIVLELATAASIEEVRDRIRRRDLSAFPAFTLAALEPGQPATIIEWDGHDQRITPFGEAHMPLISSSYDPAAVAHRRRRHLAHMADRSGGLNPAVLLMFHQSHASDPGPYSPCMHRADAETVSFSWVTVTDSEASFYYSAGAPCQSGAGESYSLTLKQEENARCLVCC